MPAPCSPPVGLPPTSSTRPRQTAPPSPANSGGNWSAYPGRRHRRRGLAGGEVHRQFRLDHIADPAPVFQPDEQRPGRVGVVAVPAVPSPSWSGVVVGVVGLTEGEPSQPARTVAAVVPGVGPVGRVHRAAAVY